MRMTVLNPMPVATAFALLVAVAGPVAASADLHCAKDLVVSLVVAMQVVAERVLDGDVRGALEALAT